MSKAASRTCASCHGEFVRGSRSESLKVCKPCSIEFKWCSACLEPHELEMFSRDSHTTDGLRSHCRTVDRGMQLVRRYGVDLDAFNSMVKSQDSECLICLERFDDLDFVVDHDHATGKVRGLLCTNCNVAIGHLRDDPAIAIRAAEYLSTSLAA